jgi:hypothetical protein
MVRASYFHEISRLVFRIYLSVKYDVNKDDLDSVLPPNAPTGEITAYLQSHPRMVAEAKMIQRNEISSCLNRSILLQENIHSSEVHQGTGIPGTESAGRGARDGLRI